VVDDGATSGTVESSEPGDGGATVEISPDMKMSWEYVDDSIRITLECNSTGYCGVGLGNQMMFPTDMIVMINDEANGPGVSDYYSTSYDPPETDESQGGTNDLVVESVGLENGVMMATVVRKLDTGDEKDFTIEQGAQIDMCYALHPTDTTFGATHSDYGGLTVTLDESGATSGVTAGVNPVDDYEEIFEEHGEELTIMWFLLAPLAIILARYAKFMYLWFWLHVIMMSFVVVWTLNSVWKAYDDNASSWKLMVDDEEQFHSRIGFTLASLLLA
jgi:hypothetical protein